MPGHKAGERKDILKTIIICTYPLTVTGFATVFQSYHKMIIWCYKCYSVILFYLYILKIISCYSHRAGPKAGGAHVFSKLI